MSKYMCMDTLRFLLFDVHGIEDLLSLPKFQDHDIDSFNIFLEATKSWADQDFFPYYREMDEKPAYFKEDKVISHPILKKIFQEAGENGWIGNYFDYEEGGVQMPYLIANAGNHIIESANNHIPGYLGLTAGAAHLITSFGSQILKDTYVPPMLSGKWGGTMALTEPQSGSSLSNITTRATPVNNGTYNIKGQKIFISGGDHEAVENFVHLTLARIEGAPSGTRGISLFAVPKYRVAEDQSLVYNDVKAVADFQKLGQRGYSTVHLVYGENDSCYGYLVGEPNQGLKCMFQMMNGARIDVGMTAASTATAAYYASLQYAQERTQGKKLGNATTDDQSLIINHPDVRRMLLTQKSIVEGSLSLLLAASKWSDIAHVGTGIEKKNATLLLELITPIAKTYPAEMGRYSINQGLQILGGYGYCMDFPLQQYLRDIRIMAIYEGTTGIQSLDLLGRKIPMENGAALLLYVNYMNSTIVKTKTHTKLNKYGESLSKAIDVAKNILKALTTRAVANDMESYLADATVFMEIMGHITIAHQWLLMAEKAQSFLDNGNNKYASEFLKAKIHSMQFYFTYELPKIYGLESIATNNEKLTHDFHKPDYLF